MNNKDQSIFRPDNLRRLDLGILTPVILLCLIGAMQIFSSTYFPERAASPLFYNQLIFYLISAFLILITATFSYKVIKAKVLQSVIFLVTLATLLLVLFIGEEVFGAKRWISFGSITLQPSEFAKLTIVLHTAFFLTIRSPFIRKRNKAKSNILAKMSKYLSSRTRIYIGAIGVWLIYAILVLQQKSMGNTLMITGVLVIMLIYKIPKNLKVYIGIFIFILGLILGLIATSINQLLLVVFIATTLLIIMGIKKYMRISITFLIALVTVGIGIRPGIEFAYTNVLQPYQRVRIESFLSPEEDQAASWNRQQAEIALGSGRFFGKGFLQGTHTNYQYLPFSYTDFAFASIGEQFGFVGIITVSMLYLILLTKIISLSRKVDDPLAELLCIGISAMIFLNMFQHMGMNVGILPITGVPLPFISYGGSALLATSIGIGILLSISADTDNKKANVVKHSLNSKR